MEMSFLSSFFLVTGGLSLSHFHYTRPPSGERVPIFWIFVVLFVRPFFKELIFLSRALAVVRV